MGTRHLIAVVKGGEYKVAQYGQWDGYPSGQGVTLVKFLKSKERIERLRHNLDYCTFFTEEEWKTETESVSPATFFKKYPHVSRDVGADILDYAMNASESNPLKLRNSIAFAGDSLFCEYAYVINMDNDTLEVYKGFNKDSLGEAERFKDAAPDDGSDYKPVKFVTSYKFEELKAPQEWAINLEKLISEEEI